MSDAPRFGRANACCVRRAAASAEATFCGECGSPILRCMAYAECGGLLDASGICDVCVNPSLFLDAGARADGSAGGALVLPLVFRNDSQIRRPLFVTNVWVGEGDGQPARKQDMGWERLEAGASNPLWVQTGELRRKGRQLFEITFAIATRYGRREEAFAFRSGLHLDVAEGGNVTINPTINTGDNRTGSGDAIMINVNAGDQSGARQDIRTEPSRLAIVNADMFEKQIGLRGYTQGSLSGARVARNAKITFKGFAKGEAPEPRPITTPDSLIVAGRNNLRSEGGDTDVRLIVRDKQGAQDRDTSLQISRRHLEFFLQNGRFCVNVAGGAGVLLNDQKLPHDTIEALNNDDVIKVLPGTPDALALQVKMRADFGEVKDITISRIPAVTA